MQATALILGAAQKAQLGSLRAHAIANPMDVIAIKELVKTREGLAAHLRHMVQFSLNLPVAFVVTFSVETGHGSGPCRHLSMSSKRRGRTPTPEAVWMIAELLGFVGALDCCAIWEEGIGGGDVAINVVQPVALDVTTMKVLN